MFIGHLGVAFAAKKLAPRMSFGLLVFATEFLDLIWPIVLLAGIEHVRIVPGIMAASPLDFTDYPISHSLVTVIGWSVLIGGAYFLIQLIPSRCLGRRASRIQTLGTRCDCPPPRPAHSSRGTGAIRPRPVELVDGINHC